MRRSLSMFAIAAIALAAGTGSAAATTEPPDTTADTATDVAEPEGTVTESTAPVGTIPDPAECAGGLTLEEGVLTVATGEPAFPPYVIDDDPTSGEGFEAAVAYAVAAQMGFEADAVEWIRTPFEAAIQPGPKDFDFNLQQYSISPEREEVVSFSLPYYTSTQAIIAFEGTPAAEVDSLPDLQELRIGVASGTTTLAFVEDVIQPADTPQVFNDNAAVVAAMNTQQIDAIVVDLPTAIFLAAVELEGAIVVGQFPPIDSAEGEPWGLLFEQDNPLVECADYALLNMRQSGELEAITTEWMEESTNVPVIDLE
jgi:polar amino acid transport system substrate-binding protein